ncbi:MAG TPA: response regulator [Flavisolibacter sp.]|nr:response regulator [Flavisolibacter sp.]
MNESMTKPAVLLVEDDPDDLFFLTEAFQDVDNSYTYVEAYDGEAALAILKDMHDRGEQPALIVLDINMPILSGRELLTILKDDPNYRNIPIVVFTTSSNPFDRQHCQHYQVDLITKPLSHKGLNGLVKYMLRYIKQAPVTDAPASLNK